MTSTLKVDKIVHSGGTTGMTIDSSGRVLTPARPTLFADMYNGSSAAYDTIANLAIVPFRNKISGTGITLNEGVFTVPVDGFYQINATVFNNNDEDIELALTVNGTDSTDIVLRAFRDEHRFVQLHMALPLSASDACRILNYSGANRGFHRNTNANDRYTALSVYLIG